MPELTTSFVRKEFASYSRMDRAAGGIVPPFQIHTSKGWCYGCPEAIYTSITHRESLSNSCLDNIAISFRQRHPDKVLPWCHNFTPATFSMSRLLVYQCRVTHRFARKRWTPTGYFQHAAGECLHGCSTRQHIFITTFLLCRAPGKYCGFSLCGLCRSSIRAKNQRDQVPPV